MEIETQQDIKVQSSCDSKTELNILQNLDEIAIDTLSEEEDNSNDLT